MVTRTTHTRIEVALSSSSSSSDSAGGGEEEDALEAWGKGHEHLRLDMLANEATHRRMVEVSELLCPLSALHAWPQTPRSLASILLSC